MAIEIKRRLRLFRRTKELEDQIDTFLNQLSESGLIFRSALRTYLSEGPGEDFERKLHDVNRLESENDHLRRIIETQLYTHTLIPESRGDVLGLLENLDHIHGIVEGTLWQFEIEKPVIPQDLIPHFDELVSVSVEALESLVLASRAFFRNIEAVGDHMHKVMYYEKEADKIGTKLKRQLFGSDLSLVEKAYLRNLADAIDNVADRSEDVADRLAIYVIKRSN